MVSFEFVNSQYTEKSISQKTWRNRFSNTILVTATSLSSPKKSDLIRQKPFFRPRVFILFDAASANNGKGKMRITFPIDRIVFVFSIHVNTGDGCSINHYFINCQDRIVTPRVCTFRFDHTTNISMKLYAGSFRINHGEDKQTRNRKFTTAWTYLFGSEFIGGKSVYFYLFVIELIEAINAQD